MDRRRSGRRNIKPKKSLVQKCKDCLRQFIAFLFSNVGIICLVVGYTVGGAVMFQYIESEYKDMKDFKFTANDYQEINVDADDKHFQFNDNEYNDNNTFAVNLDIFCNKTVEILWNFASSKVGLNETEFKIKVERKLKKFQNIVVNGVKDLDYDGKFIYSDRWTISAAFLYCLTVITTIGYGNVFPRSVLGKVATIVYAIFGMPLFLLYLSNIGDLLAKSFKWLYAKFCLCKICRLRRRRILNGDVAAPAVPSLNSWRTASEKTWPNSNLDIRSQETEGEESDDEDTDSSKSTSTVSTKDPQDITVPISLCLTIMIGFISIGALLFSGQEGLDFLDGSYFCFISLSTIGFGDIVPTTSKGRRTEDPNLYGYRTQNSQMPKITPHRKLSRLLELHDSSTAQDAHTLGISSLKKGNDFRIELSACFPTHTNETPSLSTKRFSTLERGSV